MLRFVRLCLLALAASLALALLLPAPAAEARKGCPAGMRLIQGKFCIDRYEASMDVVNSKGKTQRRHSPYHQISPDQRVRARTRRGVVPQAFITQEEAAIACETAGKRLCTDDEWVTACKGKKPTLYPYGEDHVAKRCNDYGESPLLRVFGNKSKEELYGYDSMNDPRLNKLKKTVARTGSHSKCRNSYGLHDMVGNLHEWTSNKTGVFRGGYYLDTHRHGRGCDYKTTGHNTKYSDYSVGFRCCSRPGGEKRPKEIRIPVPKGSAKAKDFERKKKQRIAARKRASK